MTPVRKPAVVTYEAIAICADEIWRLGKGGTVLVCPRLAMKSARNGCTLPALSGRRGWSGPRAGRPSARACESAYRPWDGAASGGPLRPQLLPPSAETRTLAMRPVPE